ncbi:hypothetical protein HDR61_01400 [bacterium]|nr:hypothetical protein [bacterium]
MKAQLIMIGIRLVMGAIALGVGIWYLSSSIGGAAITYTSMDNFMSAIGASNDIAGANGCFMCGYVSELFGVIGRATEMFWTAILDWLWVLMALGFGVFLFISAIQHIFAAAKDTAKVDANEKKLEFKSWFDKVWRQGARIMIVGAMIGALGMGGTTALRSVASVTITPVMFVGAELSMAATGTGSAAQCNAIRTSANDAGDILNPIMGPFMCVVGNLNSVMLAGAAGGFALMNYAWMGMGGGIFTWVAGLALVLMFLVIGFNLFFQVLSVVFKLVFLIIFLPFFLAAAAFEKTWKMASGLTSNAINMLVKSAVQIVGITLKVLIIYATVSYAADEFFPGPADGYSAIFPPILSATPQNPDAQTMSVIQVFSECERVATIGGEMDADAFKNCFVTRKASVEQQYPGAFDFMSDGWDFLMLMIGLFLLYFYVVEPRVNKILAAPGKDEFDFGTWTKDLGKKIWSAPTQIFGAVSKAMGKKD